MKIIVKKNISVILKTFKYFQVPTFAYEKRLSRIETLRLAITYISFMDELVTTNGSSSTNNNLPRKPLREENSGVSAEPPLNNLVAAAAAGLALRPPHSAYMNSIVPLHHPGVCHQNKIHILKVDVLELQSHPTLDIQTIYVYLV